MKWQIRLVDGWNRAWSWLSMQVAALGVAFGAMTAEAQAAVLDMVGIAANRVTLVLGLLMMAARLVSQTPKAPPEEPRE